MYKSTSESATARPAGALPAGTAKRLDKLAALGILEVAQELLSRLREDGLWKHDSGFNAVAARLASELRERLNVHNNRFSAQRYHDLFRGLLRRMKIRPRLDEATVVDIGCGGTNPGGLLFLCLALGAKRGFAVDMDHILDQKLAVRALADVASMMILDPQGLVGDFAISASQVLHNLASFDLAKLQSGDARGLDTTRLNYLQQSAEDMSIGDGEANFVLSQAFLEHVSDPAKVLREIARITAPSGIGSHVIDMTDHRRYGEEIHPLEFLEEDAPGMAHGSNRLRRSAFVALCEAQGLEVLQVESIATFPVSAEMRRRMAPQFAQLPQEDLETGIVRIETRKR